MLRNLFALLLFTSLTACAIGPQPNPELVQKIDSYFSGSKADIYAASKRFKHPMPYKVGQYVITGTTHRSKRSVQKMALVGKEGGGWIIETHSLSPTRQSITQMMVVGMETSQKTGKLDAMEIKWIKTKTDDKPAKKYDTEMLNKVQLIYKNVLLGFDNHTNTPVDSGTVRVAAGIFNGTVKSTNAGTVMGRRFEADAWLHPSIPINGMVKSVHKNHDIQLELLDFGLSGAERSF